MTIPWWHPSLGDDEAAAVASVVDEQFPNDGRVTEEFAGRIAEICGRRYGVGVSSGSAALYCGLKACGVGPGDEVIVPDLTFVATANAVALTGASPVLVDIRLPDMSLDPAAVEAAIGPRTRAVMPVHVNGRGGSIEEVVALARKGGLAVVEDACEALASRCAGRPLGGLGDVGCFSFAPTKIITTGQGGVVVTDDEAIERRLRELKDQGRAQRGTGGADSHPVYGFNFKLTNVQAAIGNVQLDRLAPRLEHLEQLRAWYEHELSGLEPHVELVPVDSAGGERLAWIDVFVDRRDELVSALLGDAIQAREFWHPVHTHPPYAREGAAFPNATWASAHGLWLPSALSLTREHVARVGEAIRRWAPVGARA